MNEEQFDNSLSALETRISRRGALGILFGVVGIAAAGGIARKHTVEAARRGFEGPSLPTAVPSPTPTPGGGIEGGEII